MKHTPDWNTLGPELLEALKEAAEALEVTAKWVGEQTKAKGTAAGIYQDAKRARTIIAKAKGQSREGAPFMITGEDIMALHKRWMDAGCPTSIALNGQSEGGV